jgi:hypothetical protein
VARGPAARDELEAVVRAAFGPGRRLAAVRRLRGGSKKGVYRLSLDDGRTVIGYTCADAENYCQRRVARPPTPSRSAKPREPACSRRRARDSRPWACALRGCTCSTALCPSTRPRSHWSRTCAAETLEQWLERGDPGAQQVLARLAETLRDARLPRPSDRQGRAGRQRRRASGPDV